MKIAVVGVVAVSLFALTGCGTKQGYVARGNRLYDQGKYAEASLEYRKAIQKDRQYGEAYYRLGLAAIKQNEATLAYEALLHAVDLLPDRIDAKEKFADVCLAFYLADARRPRNYYTKLTQISDELLAKNPNSFKGLEIRAYLASLDRKPAEAIALFRKALQIDASDPAITGALAQNLFRNGDSQEAEKLALDLIARHKTYGPAYDLLYQQYVSEKRLADAENIVKTKVNNNPTNAGFVLELARFYARAQRPAEMQGSLQRLLNDPKDFPDARMRVGDFYAALRDYPEAIHNYDEGSKSDSKRQIAYQKRITNVLLAEGKNSEASAVVEQILKEDAHDSDALTLRADFLLKTHKPENVDEAERELQALSKKAPDNGLTWFLLGDAARRKGDLAAAVTRYQEAIRKQKDNLPARYELAEVYLMQQRPQEALQQGNEILKLRPNDYRGRLLHARILSATGNFEAARTELNDLIKASPKDPEPQLELGLVALGEHKSQEALAIFSKLQNTGDPRAIAGLARTYLSQKQVAKAFQTLQEATQKTPDSALLQEEFARVAAVSGKYDLAVAEYEKLVAKDPKSIDKRISLGELYEIKGDSGHALLTYQQAAQVAPNDLRVELALAGALANAGRNGEARTQYEKIVMSYPDNPGALNNAAFFLSNTGGNLDEALKLAQRALEKAPGQPGFSDTIGYIYLKKGQRESAIQTFSNLVRKYPQYATFRYHLGLALYENGDHTGARRELEAALADHPAQQDAQRIRELLDKIS